MLVDPVSCNWSGLRPPLPPLRSFVWRNPFRSDLKGLGSVVNSHGDRFRPLRMVVPC